MNFMTKAARIINVDENQTLQLLGTKQNLNVAFVGNLDEKQMVASVVYKEGTVVNNKAIYVPNGFYVDLKDPRWDFLRGNKIKTKYFNSSINRNSEGVLINPQLFGVENMEVGTDVTDYIGLNRFPKNHKSVYSVGKEKIYPPVPRFKHPLKEVDFKRLPEGDYSVISMPKYDVIRCGWLMGSFYVGCGKHFYQTTDKSYYWYHAIKNRLQKVTESLNDGEFLYCLMDRVTKQVYIWDLYLTGEGRFYDYAALVNLFDDRYFAYDVMNVNIQAASRKGLNGEFKDIKEKVQEIGGEGSYILRRTHESKSETIRPIMGFSV